MAPTHVSSVGKPLQCFLHMTDHAPCFRWRLLRFLLVLVVVVVVLLFSVPLLTLSPPHQLAVLGLCQGERQPQHGPCVCVCVYICKPQYSSLITQGDFNS